MKILVSGSTGFIGQKLVSFLKKDKHTIKRLTTQKTNSYPDETIHWDPLMGRVEGQKLEGVDAVVHLAGESIASGRWTDSKKKRILESRIKGTAFISQLISEMKIKPKVLISASAVGYYGNQGENVLTEDSPAGKDFLSQVCQAWEDSTAPAKNAGIRVVNPRIGIVLGKNGGALKQMLLPFKLGVGGRLGSGDQFMSWIELTDLVRGLAFLINSENINGAVNMVSPDPITNKEFTKVLGCVLKRPTVFPVPEFALRFVLGELADALLLSSARVTPRVLLESGFKFLHADLESGLQAALKE